MKQKELEKYLKQETWYHATTLTGWKNICKEKVQVEYNKGSELDFGYGFYLTPKYEQAKRYIDRMLPYLPKKNTDDQIPVIIEFNLCLKYLMNQYTFKSFINFNEEFADFVFMNRINPNNKNHEYDFIIGVMTDANPIKLLLEFRNGNIDKKEVISNFEKGNSMQQLSLHNQAICDKLIVTRAICLDNGKELDVNDYNGIL